jgi:PTS system nitrogen regulatory IIA component
VAKELKGTDKKGIIKEMAELMKSAYKSEGLKVNDVIDKISKREKVGSTGIGGGIAVPHAKIDGLQTVLCGFGRVTAGIDFDAVDGAPVNIVFMLLTPKNNADLNLQALQLVAQITKQPNFCKFLKEAKDAKEIMDILLEFDETPK